MLAWGLIPVGGRLPSGVRFPPLNWVCDIDKTLASDRGLLGSGRPPKGVRVLSGLKFTRRGCNGAQRRESIDFLLSVFFSTFKNILLHELNIFYFSFIPKNSYNLN